MSVPVVSVVMITYGHEKFIQQAIESILQQNCSYSFEIVIANDNSPDQSDDIINAILKETKPGVINYIKHEQNMGMMPNLIFALKQAKGKYIALCDGDDYWTDPLKLQKQTDFLEQNPDYNMALGRYQFLYQNTGAFKNNRELFNINKPLLLKNYIAFNFGHTSTFLFRNSLEFPEWLNTVFAGDQSLFIINTKDKKIKYFSDFFSVYRINGGGVTNFVKAQQSVKNTENFLNIVDEYTGGKYHLLIKNRKRLNGLYFYFESATNSVVRNMMRIPIIMTRWLGINILVRFVKK